MRARTTFLWRLLRRGRHALPLLLLLAAPSHAPAREHIRFGITPGSLLAWIAQEKGLFQKHGVRVETKIFSSGRAALDALVGDEVDLATASDFAFNSRLGASPNLRILASTSVIRTARLIGRRDRGAGDVSNLPGKKIGVTLGSVGEFFLTRYLTLHGIDIGSVTLADLKPEQVAQGLVDGTLDAGITWDPFITDAEGAMKDNAVLLPGQVEHFYFFLLITTKDWAERHPKQAGAVLSALIEAETFCSENAQEAKRILQKTMGYGAGSVDRLWPLHSLHVSLPQALIFNLEVQASWGMKKNVFPAGKLPKFLDHVVTEPLAALRPNSVGIVK